MHKKFSFFEKVVYKMVTNCVLKSGQQSGVTVVKRYGVQIYKYIKFSTTVSNHFFENFKTFD